MPIVEGFEVRIVNDFAEIAREFHERINRTVYCVAATIDKRNRPKTRVLHPIWEGNTGWIWTYRDSPKAAHLVKNPHISLAYAVEPFKPVYVECTAAWMEDLNEKKRVWELCAATPPPMGGDPALGFPGHDYTSVGLLKLTPWRIQVYTLGVGAINWQREIG